ncbi:MAG: hypothetical protein ACI8TQ_001274 [Planctomycetota bacterium]|jgi:hypothetical protein
MPNIDVLTRVKKETMAEVHRYGEEQGLHHFYWRLKSPDTACIECKRRDNRLVNVYEIKYTLDTEFCKSKEAEICAFEIEATNVLTVVDERERQLEVIAEIEKGGAKGVRWHTADVEGLADRCIKRDGRVFDLGQVRRELSGDFCKFADPEKGCECTFEVATEDEVAQVTAPPVAEAAPDKKSGCGAGILLFALIPAGITYLTGG